MKASVVLYRDDGTVLVHVDKYVAGNVSWQCKPEEPIVENGISVYGFNLSFDTAPNP